MDKTKLSKKEISDGAKLVEKYKKRYVAVSKATKPILISLVALLGGAAGAGGYFTYKYVTNGGGSSPVTPVEDNKVTVVFEDMNGNLQERRIEKGKSFKEAGIEAPSTSYPYFDWGYYDEKDAFVPVTEDTVVTGTSILYEKTSIGYKFDFPQDYLAYLEDDPDPYIMEIKGTITGHDFVCKDNFKMILDDDHNQFEIVQEPILEGNTFTAKIKVIYNDEQDGLKISFKQIGKQYVTPDSEIKEIKVYEYKEANLEIDDKWTYSGIKIKNGPFTLKNRTLKDLTFEIEYDNDTGADKEIALTGEDADGNAIDLGYYNFEAGKDKKVTISIDNPNSYSNTTYSLKGVDFKSAKIDFSKAIAGFEAQGIKLNSEKTTSNINNSKSTVDIYYDMEEGDINLTLGHYNSNDDLIEQFNDINFYYELENTEFTVTKFDKIVDGETLFVKVVETFDVNVNSIEYLGTVSIHTFENYKISKGNPIPTIWYDNDSEESQTCKLAYYNADGEQIQDPFTVTFDGDATWESVEFEEFTAWDKLSEEDKTIYIKKFVVKKTVGLDWNYFELEGIENVNATEEISTESNTITISYDNDDQNKTVTLALYDAEGNYITDIGDFLFEYGEGKSADIDFENWDDVTDEDIYLVKVKEEAKTATVNESRWDEWASLGGLEFNSVSSSTITKGGDALVVNFTPTVENAQGAIYLINENDDFVSQVDYYGLTKDVPSSITFTNDNIDWSKVTDKGTVYVIYDCGQ